MLATKARMHRVAVLALLVVPACAPPTLGEDVALDDEACAFDDVPFDPHGGLVLQGTGDRACVRLEREPLADDVRRGTEWRALSLSVVVDGRALEARDDGLAYENSHHNCRDVVTTLALALDDDVTLAIDGASVSPDVCFSGAPEEWRL